MPRWSDLALQARIQSEERDKVWNYRKNVDQLKEDLEYWEDKLDQHEKKLKEHDLEYINERLELAANALKKIKEHNKEAKYAYIYVEQVAGKLREMDRFKLL